MLPESPLPLPLLSHTIALIASLLSTFEQDVLEQSDFSADFYSYRHVLTATLSTIACVVVIKGAWPQKLLYALCSRYFYSMEASQKVSGYITKQQQVGMHMDGQIHSHEIFYSNYTSQTFSSCEQLHLVLVRDCEAYPIGFSEPANKTEQRASLTRGDPALFPVLQCLQEGWPEPCDAKLTSYFSRRDEYTKVASCGFTSGNARKVALHKLHNGHWGISRMKSLPYMYVWWPGMDARAYPKKACLPPQHFEPKL